MCRTICTEHLLNAGRQIPYIQKRARNLPHNWIEQKENKPSTEADKKKEKKKIKNNNNKKG